MATVTEPQGAALLKPEPERRRRSPLFRLGYQGSRSSLAFRATVLALSLAVAALLIVALYQLVKQAWDQYHFDVSRFVHDVFGSEAVIQSGRNTAIIVLSACVLATAIATLLAWLNEGTEASIGSAGSLLPVVPFLMPALSLPLGWQFLASHNAGVLNIVIRNGLSLLGIHLDDGPLNINSMYGMIFLYTIFLTGFAYLIMSSAIRNVDTNILEAARLAGARPLQVFREILVPSIRSSFLAAFLLCLLPALAMYTVPIVIGPEANISVLSVTIVNMVNGLYPPEFGKAFLTGLLLLIPILIAWLVSRRAGRGRGQAMLSTVRGSGSLMVLGKAGRRAGRAVLIIYMIIAVVLPVLGLLWVSGVSFWSDQLTTAWNPWANIQLVWQNSGLMSGIKNSLLLGIVGGLVIMIVAQTLAFGQRMFPRFGAVLDGFTKAPAAIASILLAMGVLLTFEGNPFNLQGTYWLLFLGFFIAYLPFASVVAGAGLLQIGKDVVEASQVSGASEARTFRRIVRPLTRANFVAGWVLVFILVVGDVNMSLMLSSSAKPTIGFEMLSLQTDSAFPTVATYALFVAVVNVVVTGLAFAGVGVRSRKR